MSRFFLLLAVAVLTTAPAISQRTAKTYALKNGNWYNGATFTPGDWYIQKGVFTQKAPSKIDSTLDLGGAWIIPPMGDAYCTNVTDSPLAAEMIQRYWEEGVFYLQVPQNTQNGRTETTKRAQRAAAPDVTFANGTLTAPYGYPFMEVEGPAHKLYDPKQWNARFDTLKVRKKLLGDAYWFITDDKASFAENWKKYMAQNPEVVFIQLLDAANNGGKEKTGGLTPAAAKAVVKKAHKSKLRVFANIKTAADVRLCLEIGVDGIVNLPGNTWDGVSDLKPYELSDADIDALAKAKIIVIPLLFKGQSVTAREAVSGHHQTSLRRLLEKGVHVAIGSDDIQRTIRPELNYWVTTLATDLQSTQAPGACGCFYKKGEDEKMALRILCEYTPQAIFPKRKIGKIAEGYEASFLALNNNPIDNLLKTRAFSFKVKNGVFYSK